VGIDVKDSQIGMALCDGSQDWIRNRVISAEGKRTPPVGEKLGDAGFDPVSRSGIGGREVAGVTQIGDVGPELGCEVPVRRAKLGPDQRRRVGRAPQERGGRIVGNSDQPGPPSVRGAWQESLRSSSGPWQYPAHRPPG
jgi:hypothetical protein